MFRYRVSSKKVKPKPIYDLPERLHQRWEDMNVRRLMKQLLVLKQFDPETIAQHIKPEKDRIAYDKLKQHAMEENFCNIQHEISDIRTRLAPVQSVDEEIERLNFIEKDVDNMIAAKIIGFRYEDVKDNLQEKFNVIKSSKITIDWHKLLLRAQQQRFQSDKLIFERKKLLHNTTENKKTDNQTTERDVSTKNVIINDHH